jgi:outer membrane protein assembly factor BamB
MNAVWLRICGPTAAASAVAVALIVGWLGATAAVPAPVRVPIKENVIRRSTAVDPSRNQGTLIPGEGTASKLPGRWPQFRNADQMNVGRDVPPLARSWDERKPRTLWSVKQGKGHSGAAIHDGRVYIMDYDAEKDEDIVRCLSLDDGAEIWRYTYYVKVRYQHGYSRTVPAVAGGYVVTLGPKCHVVCLNAETGALVWKKDLVAEHGTRVPQWYAGQCPLIDGDRVILAPGGDPLMMAVELATGNIIWQTPNPDDWQMTHSSVARMGEQYVYCASRGVVGVSVEDGRVMWRRKDWFVKPSNMPVPIVAGGGRVLVTGNYGGTGAVMIRVTDPTTTETLWRTKVGVFGSDQQTAVLYDNYLYGVRPGKGELVCLGLNGEEKWASGTANSFGLGPYLVADGKVFVLADQRGKREPGTLCMIEAAPDGYRELAAMKLLDGHDAWGPMAIVGNRLILRDETNLICVELPTAK